VLAVVNGTARLWKSWNAQHMKEDINCLSLARHYMLALSSQCRCKIQGKIFSKIFTR
jgi:hypothetical protein